LPFGKAEIPACQAVFHIHWKEKIALNLQNIHIAGQRADVGKMTPLDKGGVGI
jgi:hypothetical protein